jgi:hypothetical protein
MCKVCPTMGVCLLGCLFVVMASGCSRGTPATVASPPVPDTGEPKSETAQTCTARGHALTEKGQWDQAIM